MMNVTSTDAVNTFHQLLRLVERGETVRISKHGKAKARLVPDCDFMDAKEFAKAFAGHKASKLDVAAADEIAKNIERLNQDEYALAH